MDGVMRAARRRAGRAIRKCRRDAEAVRLYCRAIGVELLPWQVEWMTAWLRGTPQRGLRRG